MRTKKNLLPLGVRVKSGLNVGFLAASCRTFPESPNVSHSLAQALDILSLAMPFTFSYWRK
jgi:hypothetical protein